MKIFADPFIKDGYLYEADKDRWFSLEEGRIGGHVVFTSQKSKDSLEKAAALPIWAVEQVLEINERDWQEVTKNLKAE